MEPTGAREFVAGTVRALARGQTAAKVRAVDAAIFDQTRPSIRSVAKSEGLPESTVRALVVRVLARGRVAFRA